MPVKLGSKLASEQEARIEIIPLIDIMFFLLAAFMLVSLSMVTLKSVKVDLPTATSAAADAERDLISLTVDRSGVFYLEKEPIGRNELSARLTALLAANPELRVYVSGDREARHGDIIAALDAIRGAGVQKVAFEIRTDGGSVSPTTSP